MEFFCGTHQRVPVQKNIYQIVFVSFFFVWGEKKNANRYIVGSSVVCFFLQKKNTYNKNRFITQNLVEKPKAVQESHCTLQIADEVQ